MSSLDKTMHFDFNQNKGKNVYDTLQDVYNALEEKGYSPINQIVGYLLSGDPAYIPRHNDARNLILKHERDEIIEELVKSYLGKNCDYLDLMLALKLSVLQSVTLWGLPLKSLKQLRLTKASLALVCVKLEKLYVNMMLKALF